MPILSWPTGLRNPNSVSLALVANTQSGGRSPFDGTEQTLELPGSRWSAEIRWQNLPETQWRIMQAFIASLGGRAGRFTWGPNHMPRRGTRGGAAQVFGGGQTGRSLVTGFWSGSGLAFAVGDIVGWTDPVGREVFHMVTADAPVDGSNAATLQLAPPIRRSPTNGTALNLTNPRAVWRTTGDATALEYERGVFAAVQLSIEEAIF
tara:strand:- start:27984 stop:28601 length:618 start_codon:yes stop_codon:yes gene_type:complete